MVDGYSKLITSIAALFGAVAWPVTFLAVIFLFRGEVRSALKCVLGLLNRVNKVQLAAVVLEMNRTAEIESESGDD
jgi:hypothetical protein